MVRVGHYHKYNYSGYGKQKINEWIPYVYRVCMLKLLTSFGRYVDQAVYLTPASKPRFAISSRTIL